MKFKSILVLLLPATVAYGQNTYRLETPISHIEKNGIVVLDNEAAEILEEHGKSLFNFTEVYLDKSSQNLKDQMVILPGSVEFSSGTKLTGFFFGKYSDIGLSEKIDPKAAKHFYSGATRFDKMLSLALLNQALYTFSLLGDKLPNPYMIEALATGFDTKALDNYTVYFLDNNVVPKIQAPQVFSTLYPGKYAIVNEAGFTEKLLGTDEDAAIAYYSQATGRLFIFAPKSHELLYYTLSPSYAVGWDAYYLKILLKKYNESKK